MIKQIAEGVWVHESTFLQSNAVIVQGNSGVLLIDPGITRDEMATIAEDLQKLDQAVIAGFSTHPHWDHLLWDAQFGEAPRYGSARCETEIKNFLSKPDWKTQIVPMLPADLIDEIPIDDLFGKITGLPPEATYIPWDGPKVRIIANDGHAAGSAALLIEDMGVLVAGDMLSDILTPFLELDADDPVKDYLSALQLFDDFSQDVKVFVPGHGSVGDSNALNTRINQDRTYVQALSNGSDSSDLRLTEGPQKNLLANVHSWHQQQIASKHK